MNVKPLVLRSARLGLTKQLWPPLTMAAVGRVIVPLIAPLAVLVLWQTASMQRWLSPQILPAPALVCATLFDLIRNGEIASNLQISLHRIAVGLLIGTSFGVGLGILLGVSKRLDQYLGPTIYALSQIPSLGWVPILILIFGLDEMVKYLIIAKACFVPSVVATKQGIRNIPRSYLDVARVLRLSRRAMLMKLIIPATLPTLFSGLRLALSSAWISLIVVEMLAATEGVGYMMVWGRTLFQTDIVISGMIVIGVIGLVMDRGLAVVERALRRWETTRD